ncbi:hypothetical protein [Pannonibacter phragmitetus]|uniref:hypothetical protein n=1 Tax=Pannonibacter phragmitetus TaxID=121719 RepID=UPI003D2EFF44
MCLRPVPAALQTPAIDNIADKVDRLGVIVLQEVEQKICLTTARAKMNIRNEQGPVMLAFLQSCHVWRS